MPSTFPGMDPYLEGDMWQEVHERLVNQIGYERLLDYTSPPPAPEFNTEDAAWFDAVLRTAGYCTSPHT